MPPHVGWGLYILYLKAKWWFNACEIIVGSMLLSRGIKFQSKRSFWKEFSNIMLISCFVMRYGTVWHVLLVNHALSIIAHPRLPARKIMEWFLAGGCFPLLFSKGNGFIRAKQRGERQGWRRYCCRGAKRSSVAVHRWRSAWVWWDASVFCCFPLLEHGRIPARLPSKSQPPLAGPEPSVWASHSANSVISFFKGFCSVFGFLSIGPHSASLRTAQLSRSVRFGGCLPLYKPGSAWRLMDNIWIFSGLYGV